MPTEIDLLCQQQFEARHRAREEARRAGYQDAIVGQQLVDGVVTDGGIYALPPAVTQTASFLPIVAQPSVLSQILYAPRPYRGRWY